MSKNDSHLSSHGPFRSDQLRSGDPYELSQGHPVVCLPTGGRGSRANRLGAQVLGTDPDVESAGVNTGFSPTPDTLRAPDVAVGNIPDHPGWVEGVPPLAVEYADSGQDEGELTRKIAELLAAGTQWVWVVRLTGPRRVEVHQPDRPMRLAQPGEELVARGVLRNPVLVEALYDDAAANAATLRNLLQRHGYDGLAAVRAEGEAAGEARGRAEAQLQTLKEALREVLSAKGWALERAHSDAVDACSDPALLKAWLKRASVACSVSEVFAP